MDQSAEVHEPRTLLIAEDEDHIRDLLQRVFERAGYVVVPEASGLDALAVLEDPPRRIDLLITDVSMPGLSGLELIRKARVLRPDLKIVCLSARVQDLANMQEVHYMPKPFAIAGLIQKVRDLIG